MSDSEPLHFKNQKKRQDSVLTDDRKAISAGISTLIISPYLTKESRMLASSGRSPQMRLEEAVGLARAIDLDVQDSILLPLTQIRSATYIGKGKVEELATIIEAKEIELVVMDCALSPIQQRNLEKSLAAKIIDRTGLILEIFGSRAHTKEGMLQVELAHLEYQKGRLVRSWTHLERQRGGFGFMGGPGETQIETDRRLIQERIRRIERELEAVKRTRALHRKGRERVPYPTIAFVGYTNAGKSTLFNRMTTASVLAEDMLFATLDPTSRAVTLPHGETVILSDTVGFISELPTMLIAAFRATLEDVISADILLHIRDISSLETDAQSADVQQVLNELGIDAHDTGRIIEIWNKADKLSDDDIHQKLAQISRRRDIDRPVLVSALTSEGIETLRLEIDRRLAENKLYFILEIALEDGAAAAWLYRNTDVIEREQKDDSFIFKIRVPRSQSAVFLKKFPRSVQSRPF